VCCAAAIETNVKKAAALPINLAWVVRAMNGILSKEIRPVSRGLYLGACLVAWRTKRYLFGEFRFPEETSILA
jgi:hypothetical protein